jgi:DnaJ-class molecular chaperone
MKCEVCNGTGWLDSEFQCELCGGTGEVESKPDWDWADQYSYYECEE